VALAAALRPEFSGEIRTDRFTRHLYSRDASMYSIQPLAVAFPRTAADVQTAVTVAGELSVPVLARGAGTSLAGQTVGPGLILDLSRHMRKVIEIDGERRVARVQPGVVQDDLNRAASPHGLMFAADTSTSNRATLGGMIGNNSSGSQSVRYGTTVDHVRSLEVVLSDGRPAQLGPLSEAQWRRHARAPNVEGELYRTLPAIAERYRGAIERDSPRFWRHSGGYRLQRLLVDDGAPNLAKFIVGTEGTLAIVTAAELDLVPRPRAQAIAVGHFGSVPAAIAASADALAADASAIELLDDLILSLARTQLEHRDITQRLQGTPKALLFVTFTADTPAEAQAAVRRLAAQWRSAGHGYHTWCAFGERDRDAVLKLRKSGLGLLMAASTGTRRPLAFVEDTAVPPEVLLEYVSAFSAILERHGLTAGFYGHASVGCLHIRPFVDLRNAPEIAKMRAVAQEVLELVINCGGVNSSEHGDGLARSEFNRRLFGADSYEAMREVKRTFDPGGILNPGKIVDAPAMDRDLRDVALAPAPRLTTTLQFDDGMRGLADRCMNIGACRKTNSGVMCPSYMATREEEHSTRGRANALVMALSAPDPRAALGDERLHDIMDLCLGCKACQRECPLSVDMSLLKTEFLAQYQDAHGVALRTKAFAHIRSLNRAASHAAPLANRVASNRTVRELLARRVGIARNRPLPRVQRDTLIRWFARRGAADRPAPQGELVFLADSFTTFSEPSIGQSCIELLELAGWHVRLESGVCCGRSSLSSGLIGLARRQANELVERLAPYAAAGAPIVGCEPSCILTLRDELCHLFPDDERVSLLARQAQLISTPLLSAANDGRLSLDDRAPVANRRIVFHGHCHEKAVVGTADTVALLRKIPGAIVQELDAGCCGMAGSFGFESEHYELSMRIGAQRLFPALDAEDPRALVAATGVSCRQQIQHGTGRIAHHPVELLRSAALPARAGLTSS
jgi:FAD/FMN-containing dehydrogenase/Fe-S oxidoreductase